MSEDEYAVVPAHICPACGASDCLGSEMRDMPFEYRDESTVISGVHGIFCQTCGEGFSDPAYPADWLRMSAEIDKFTKQVDTSFIESMRAIRKKLGLRQADAGKLFGGGASAFSEYERGKTQPHKSTVLLLKLLDKHPELLDELRT